MDQVDLVPTFSLLMGIPIPFSNLGRVIRGLWSGEEASSLLKYVDANVRQVMNYLDAYRNRGGKVPEKTYAALRQRLLDFSLARSGASVGGLTPSARESTIAEGLSILREAKLMCEAVWVDFDLRLINAGLVILPIQTAFMALLALTPRSKLLSEVVNSRYVHVQRVR